MITKCSSISFLSNMIVLLKVNSGIVSLFTHQTPHGTSRDERMFTFAEQSFPRQQVRLTYSPGVRVLVIYLCHAVLRQRRLEGRKDGRTEGRTDGRKHMYTLDLDKHSDILRYMLSCANLITCVSSNCFHMGQLLLFINC